MRDAQQQNHSCVEELIDRQLPDGGWPFTSRTKQSAAEPTALALLALPSDSVGERKDAIQFLLHIQNANGSWPAFTGDDEGGSGFTGLTLYALNRCNVQGLVSDRAVAWLLQSRGWESHWLWKWKFRTTDRHVHFDPGKFGWPWIPQTVSWVFPTAYSLLALKQSHGISQRHPVQLRIRRGVEMLYDRMCPEGGWNAGNGVVYGSPLAPHLDATAVALLALVGEPLTAPIAASLAWLAQHSETCFAPWSLGWIVLALDAYGRSTELLNDRLSSLVDPPEINDCATLAIASIALGRAAFRNTFRASNET